jgi:TonB family protein
MKPPLSFWENLMPLLNLCLRVALAVLAFSSGLVPSRLSADSSNQVAPTPIARDLFSSVVELRGVGNGESIPVIELGFFVRPNLIATAYKPIKSLKDISALRVQVVANKKPAVIDAKFVVDENADIALLRTTSPVGVPLSLNVKGIRLGETVTVVTGAEKGGVEFTLTKTSGAGNIGAGDGCFIDMDKQPFKYLGGPVINGHGEVIGILVDRPEPNQDLISAASVFPIVQLIGPQNKNQLLPDSVASGLPRATTITTPKTPCFEFLFGPSSLPPPPPPGTKEELPKIIRRSGGVLQESAIKRVAPGYPDKAKAAAVGGPVVVEILVDERGNVTTARVLSGHELLRDAALAAARRWKFHRVTLSGVPVKVIGTITFNFNL